MIFSDNLDNIKAWHEVLELCNGDVPLELTLQSGVRDNNPEKKCEKSGLVSSPGQNIVHPVLSGSTS